MELIIALILVVTVSIWVLLVITLSVVNDNLIHVGKLIEHEIKERKVK